MPDQNRSERLPFDTQNEPPLQRALLLFLLGEGLEWHSFDSLVEKGGFKQHDKWALLRATKSLSMIGLIVVSEEETMAASAMAHHFHWLMTEVEAPDA